MSKSEIEKSLKRFLKKKITYSLGLLVSFLISGNISLADTTTSAEYKNIENERAEILKEIEEEKKKIIELINEKEREIKSDESMTIDLIREADWYVKPSITKFSTSLIGNYTFDDKTEKDWTTGIKQDTSVDNERSLFEQVVNKTQSKQYLTSGWITLNNNFNINSQIYDYTSSLIILPIVENPTIITPGIPVVSFTAPDQPLELDIAKPTLTPISVGAVNIGNVNVTVPTITLPEVSVNVSDINVNVTEPNVNIQVDPVVVTSPQVIPPPTVSAPNIDITVNPNTAPTIQKPQVNVSFPEAPAAPNFTAFNRGRGNWLGGFNGIVGRLDWNRNNFAWEQGSPGPILLDINSRAMFKGAGTLSGQGKTSNSIVRAYTDGGGTVYNSYTNIKSDVTLAGGTPSTIGWAGLWGSGVYAQTSPVGIPGMTANTYYSASDNGALPSSHGSLPSGIVNNNVADTYNPNSVRYQQSWLFQGNPTVQDMSIQVGGSSTHSTAIYAQNSYVRMNRVNMELAGKTIIGQLSIAGVYEVDFNDVDINITGNTNSLFTTVVYPDRHLYTQSSNGILSSTWGLANTDTIASTTGVNFGGTSLSASTSENTIMYLSGSAMHRWNGQNSSVPLPGQTTPAYQVNSEQYRMYAPTFGNVVVQNSGGDVTYTGSGNVGIWVASYVPNRTRWMASGTALAPSLDLNQVYLQGDKNVGYYLAGNSGAANRNGVFQGNVSVNVAMGTNLGGATQVGTGNIAGNNASLSEDNVAIYVGSGQRVEMNNTLNGYKQYFPGTIDFTIDAGVTDDHGGNLVGIAPGSQIGFPNLAHDPITNLNITNFRVQFGQYSKDGIGIVANNGSVVNVDTASPIISDNAGSAASRATNSVLFFAEGVWFNPREVLTGGTYDKQAYGRGESVTGQKYISDFNSTINVLDHISMSSLDSIALFAKDGGRLTAKNIEMTGYNSKGAFAYGVKNYAAGTIVNSTNGAANTQPNTVIVVDNITAKVNGSGANSHNNIGAIAVSQDDSGAGLGNTSITVNGKIDVTGIGAYARGERATVSINGTGSVVESGQYGSLVALEGGKVNYKGTIEHNQADKIAFYAEKTATVTSNINFTGTTTMNITSGVVFYGDSSDYSAAGKLAGETGRYTGMGNVTVNLQANEINLGVFSGISTKWVNTTDYLNNSTYGLRLIPKVSSINDGGHWYKTSLEGGNLSIEANVNRDSVSSGATVGDGFNDISIEREQVTLETGYTVSSDGGNGLALGSNETAVANTESGYIVKGTVDISETSGATAPTGTYVNFGYVDVQNGGKIEISKDAGSIGGIGASGINGSSITNAGTITVSSSNATNQGVGIALKASENKLTTASSYGKDKTPTLTGKWGTINNSGTITVTGISGVGIYMENNVDFTAAGLTTTGVATTRTDMSITNSGTISATGDNGVGIAIKHKNSDDGAGNSVGGTLTLTQSAPNISNIIVGKGIGIYAESSDITFNGNYQISIGNGGVGLQTLNSNLVTSSATDILTIEYTGAASGSAIGLNLDETNTANNLNITLKNTGGAKSLIGLYTVGSGALTNNGNIISNSNGSYGIFSKGNDIINAGTITVGDSSIPTSGAIGIFTEDASVTTDGDKIVITGNGDGANNIRPIGVYATTTVAPASAHAITINAGTSAMNITGNSGIGIYVEDKNGTDFTLTNNSNLSLTNSTAIADRKIGIYLKNGNTTINTNSGDISVGENNLGIYAVDSTLTNSGNITIASGTKTIGIHNVATNKNLSLTNSGNVSVTGGKENIGLSSETTSTHASAINLTGGDITVTASSSTDGEIPIGVYAHGNNSTITSSESGNGIDFIVSPNAIGIYVNGNDTSSTNGNFDMSLSSTTTGKIGIGSYYKNGAYANTGTTYLTSTSTATDPLGEFIRPIGLFYGDNSTKNISDVVVLAGSNDIIGMYMSNATTATAFSNSGDITLNAKGIGIYLKNVNLTNTGIINIAATGANGAYGLYLNGGTSITNANITVSGDGSIGAIINTVGTFTNNADLTVTGSSAIGAYAYGGSTFVNTGNIVANTIGTGVGAAHISGSIGAYAKGTNSTVENTGNIDSNYLALYAEDGGTVTQTSGTVDVLNGTGIVAEGDTANNKVSTVNLNGGTISGAINDMTAVVGKNNGNINFNGSAISLTGNKSVGIAAIDGSTATLTSGTITVGVGGIGVFSDNSTINANDGTITIGNKGIALYSKDSTIGSGTLGTNGILNVTYTSATDKGIGIYYDSATGGSAVTNTTEVIHTAGGTNLISLYANGIALTNTVDQNVSTSGIGIYGGANTDAPPVASTIVNTGTINLVGENTIGIFLTGGSTTSAFGTIAGTDINTNGNYKIGIYVNDGDITGNTAYSFDINGGIGFYLKNKVVSYNGTMNISGDSTVNNRTIGVYVDSSITSTTDVFSANITLTGANGIGMYLANDGAVSPSGSTLLYSGTLDILSTSTDADKGIGVLVTENSSFDLAGGTVNIGGTNNIGFYVKEGGNLNISGGTVTNTASGTFAYLEGGSLTFASGSTLNVNYSNVIVSGATGSITNQTNITVGTTGLQGTDGATITNSNTGIINATVDDGRAMVGSGAGTTLVNSGNINLSGEKSVGIYTEDGAIATTTGNITVGDKSTAYYAGLNGVININSGATTTIGEDSSLFYLAGGTVNYALGNIVMNDNRVALTVSDTNSTINFTQVGGTDITTGKNGVGISINKDGDLALTSITGLNMLTVGENSTGIFINNDNLINTDITMDIIWDQAIGIYTEKNATINYSGNLESTFSEVKGIINTGTGDTKNDGNIQLTGISSVGIYVENGGNVVNDINGIITVGDGIPTSTAVAMYGKNAGQVVNNGDISIGTNAVGIFGENTTSISNTNTVQSSSISSTGIFGINTAITNSGTISLGDTSNGIYSDNGAVINTGDITVGNTNSSGIYGDKLAIVSHNAGTITVGNQSVGISTVNGNINVASGTNIIAGDNSTHIYSVAGDVTNASNLVLNKRGLGIFTISGNINNSGQITVGQADLAVASTALSVGLITKTGTITNTGIIDIPHESGVGMVVNLGGTAINDIGGVINANGKYSYGIQATTDTTVATIVPSTIINRGTINVNGEKARGIAATKYSIVENYGDIYVAGNRAEGIYVDSRATVANHGNIHVNVSNGIGIHLGKEGILVNSGNIVINSVGGEAIKGTGTVANVGDIEINGTNVTINGVTITNSGNITINGAFDFDQITLGSNAGYIGTINAESFENGEFVILPEVTQGSNKEMYVVQYLNGMNNLPNNGEISAISLSASFVAEIVKDPTNPNLVSIVMVKIPYQEMLSGTGAEEFGKGLDDLYIKATGIELKMFDAMDIISNENELASVFDNELRGNEYANIQTRMIDISDSFTSSYENLKENKLYSKKSLKVAGIAVGGDRNTPIAGVEDYEYTTLGAIILKEYDFKTYGKSLNWSLALGQTKFAFDSSSEESVYSVNGGIGFETFVKNNNRLKYFTRGEVTLNKHELDRKIVISGQNFENTGEFFSGMIEWKNKLRYASITSENIELGLFGTFNLGYGQYEEFSEDGDGIYLDVKSKDMAIIRPGIGTDLTFSKYTNYGKFSFITKGTAEYELGTVYDEANEVKISGADSGYYNLEKPDELKHILELSAEFNYQPYSGTNIGLEVSRKIGSTDSTSVGLNLQYQF